LQGELAVSSRLFVKELWLELSEREVMMTINLFNTMEQNQNNIFQGKTLQMVLEFLVERYGWEKLGEMIAVNCFINDPSIPSSLKFLRRTPWARRKVEDLYVDTINLDKRSGR
jgi:uncharacterized protein (DUF2132 family)